MPLTLFSLDELTSEKEAIAVAERLLDDAIDASEASRAKSQKIKRCKSKIMRVQKKCVVKNWKKPIEILKRGFDMLEEASAELSVNLWGI